MLKALHLTNIVLVESAHIEFEKAFNVLSGESGSGKSAIMNALNLIAGERSDLSYIRRGAEKGIVEAVFDIENIPALIKLLEETGIDHEAGNELLIRRELSTTGKSRAFINNQLAQISLLKQVSEHLFEIVGQHANQKLLSLDYHRHALDLYGDLTKEVAAFFQSWDHELQIEHTLQQLINSEAQRIRDCEVCRMEIEELEEANPIEGEEEELFAEYTQLSNADELLQKSGDLNRLLTGEKGVLQALNRQKANFTQLVRLAPSLADSLTSYENTLLELDEVARALSIFEARIENNPERADKINNRLELFAKLKRKYGSTLSDINAYLKNSREKLKNLENADDQIAHLKEQLKEVSDRTNTLATTLSAKRKQAALKLQKAIEKNLRTLNMPKVEIFVEVIPQKRSRYGDDKIEIFITPNVGEHRVSLRECASGGELSRTMLSMQAVLAGKENIPTLVFDEIDANIGGETATVVGEKLHSIGTQHQVLCITHFPQVAKFAQHHMRISKKEVDGRTVTIVDTLDEKAHQNELLRMYGGKNEILALN